MNQYVHVILIEVLPVFAMLAAGALSLVGIWALGKLGKKLGIQTTAQQEALVWNACHSAVAYAEEFARKKLKTDGALPPGPEKLKAALEFVRTQVEQRHLDDVGEEKLMQILEATLHVSRPALTKPVAE